MLTERAIRPVVIDRKNWLFARSDNGGKTAAIINSIVASCQRNKSDPQVYLANILPELPTATVAELVAMLPNTWCIRPAKRATCPEVMSQGRFRPGQAA